jgi:riboflavin synthase
MFTGLIQETGQIAGLRLVASKSRDSVTRITIAAKTVPSELKTGDSVAVSGVCLTAVDIRGNEFSADLAAETMQRTSLGSLKKGSVVNLELPARPQDRLGGHIVQGHVDGTAEIVSLEKVKGREDWRLVIDIPSALARYVVAQGSITVEGISLTVAQINASRVEIAIIPHTLRATNLHSLRSGSTVNLEVDVLAKYVEKLMQAKSATKLTAAELIQRGF